jgi:uncharacterized protein
MPRTMILLAGLCGLAWTTVSLAASPPPALTAAYVVAAHNSDFQPENCGRAKDDPQRPDRLRLARLVARMKDPNRRFAFGTGQANPLVLAVLADDVGLLRKLVARGGKLGTPDLRHMAMHIAAASDGPPMIDALTKLGIDPDSHARGRFTPLMLAAWNDRPASLRALLRLGADPTQHTPGGNSALAGAVFCKDPAMVKALLGHGARTDGYIHQIEQRKGTHLVAEARAGGAKTHPLH